MKTKLTRREAALIREAKKSAIRNYEKDTRLTVTYCDGAVRNVLTQVSIAEWESLQKAAGLHDSPLFTIAGLVRIELQRGVLPVGHRVHATKMLKWGRVLISK
jgi:hypothetical protein